MMFGSSARMVLAWSVLLGCLAAPMDVLGQTSAEPSEGSRLIEQYRLARILKQAARTAGPVGAHMALLPPQRLPLQTDGLQERLQALYASRSAAAEPVPDEPRFEVTNWRMVKKLEREWFAKQHAETPWAYLGSNFWTPIDTTQTSRWRAILEATFGAPTKTLAELDFSREIRLDEYIQFEYWFVLNDSIPLRVMDVNGPFERGLVVSTDQQYRDLLYDIRQAFLLDLATSAPLKPYVDYYYHTALGAWYRAGYDGARFYLKAIPRPNMRFGRPWVSSGER